MGKETAKTARALFWNNGNFEHDSSLLPLPLLIEVGSRKREEGGRREEGVDKEEMKGGWDIAIVGSAWSMMRVVEQLERGGCLLTKDGIGRMVAEVGPRPLQVYMYVQRRPFNAPRGIG